MQLSAVDHARCFPSLSCFQSVSIDLSFSDLHMWFTLQRAFESFSFLFFVS